MTKKKEEAAPAASQPIDPSPFEFTPSTLAALFDPKSLSQLNQLGGLQGLEKGLKTSLDYGLREQGPTLVRQTTTDSVLSRISTKITGVVPDDTNRFPNDDLKQRVAVYGENKIPQRKTKSLLELMYIAMHDKIMILLSIAAVVSLGLGIYEDVTSKKTFTDPLTGVVTEEAKVHWVEGFAIIVAIFIVVMVGALNDYQKEKQFQKLNAKKDDRKVKVIRDGAPKELSTYDLLVGDILLVEPGDVVPADAVFIEGHQVKCDESAVTGESDAVKKESPQACDDIAKRSATFDHLPDPFFISGGKVLEGVGKCMVVAVGQNSFNGRLLMSLQTEAEFTPLQSKLNHLAEIIAKLGSAAALLMLLVLLIEYFIQLGIGNAERGAAAIVENITRILISAVTVVVVAVPEGLPLAVTLALAFATTRMLQDNNLVRVLASCETMGNATAICSDKTGTLTQNKMTVVAGVIGVSAQFAKEASRADRLVGDKVLELTSVKESLPTALNDLIYDAVAVNSTAFEDPNTKELTGSKTETALLGWTAAMGAASYVTVRDQYTVGQVWPFSSARKSMTTVAKHKAGDGKWQVFVKGASEIIVSRCTRIIQVNGSTHEVVDLDDSKREEVQKLIVHYAMRSLRTIAIAYRELDSFDPIASEVDSDNAQQTHYDEQLTLIAIVGIEDPLRDGVTDAVARCQRAGVTVRMVTGDNILTAQAIAMQCGIYSDGGIVMEGPVFRNLSEMEKLKVIPRLQVLARSSPEDKRVLVMMLKSLGEVVAVTGDGTNDGPALKTADVGFSMGIAGTEVAKEASSIILMDDNFASIVKAIMWGRAVNDAVKKFLQFQLTVNITAVILTFVSAVADVSKQSGVLTAVQLLWVNLIMDSLAALALATDPPTPEILERLPERRNAALITPTMWKMIGGQAIMQVVVCLFLLYLGPSVTKNVSNEELQTLVFNVFVWLQLFNEINCRRLDNHLNIFQGIHRNVYFTAIFILTAVLQVIIVQFGGAAFQTVPLNGAEWGISIAIGFLSIPFGVAIRFIPDTLFVKRPAVQHADSFSKREPAQLPHDRLQQSMQEVHSQLQVFSALRGGRIKSNYHRSLAAAAVMPSLMATMVGVGYTPTVVVPPLQEGEQDVIVEQFVAQSMERKGTIRSIA